RWIAGQARNDDTQDGLRVKPAVTILLSSPINTRHAGLDPASIVNYLEMEILAIGVSRTC
ncbi:MAG: hypothetical protein Q9M13_03965, partial [Mariprofundales bacterium]|nr:hypothetical protein [Mariprofundales bacterium]